MYIKDGIAYAEKPAPEIRVCGVRVLPEHKLWVRFNTGEAKIFDFTSLLETPAFMPLADREIFASVYIDYGVTVWNEGKIDIAPEYLYENGVAADDKQIA